MRSTIRLATLASALLVASCVVPGCTPDEGPGGKMTGPSMEKGKMDGGAMEKGKMNGGMTEKGKMEGGAMEKGKMDSPPK
jgi:hypothetical protein